MSSTVWLKLKSSKNNSEFVLEDDYINFTKIIPDLSGLCNELNVMDINEFVDFTGAAEGLMDEMPEDFVVPTFEYKQTKELLNTLNALVDKMDFDVKDEVKELVSKIISYEGKFDLVALEFIA